MSTLPFSVSLAWPESSLHAFFHWLSGTLVTEEGTRHPRSGKGHCGHFSGSTF